METLLSVFSFIFFTFMAALKKKNVSVHPCGVHPICVCIFLNTEPGCAIDVIWNGSGIASNHFYWWKTNE